METKFDAELLAWFNKKLENGEVENAVEQLYALLDEVSQEIRKKVYNARAAWKRKMNRPERESAKKRVEAFFASLSPEDIIKYQNTPWTELPEWLRNDLPSIVMRPEECNFVRIYDLVNKEQRQQEISASRIVRYMKKYGFITSDDKGTHLHYDRLSKVCNDLAEDYDLKWVPGKRAQRTRITPEDLKSYVQCRITPKPDKMAILSKATGLPVWYLGGYLKPAIPDIMPENPLEPAPMPGKFKKTRVKRA